MKSQRKVWELQSQTVCKVIGMALDLGDLKKLAGKFGIRPSDPLLDHEFALHSTAVHLCCTDNPVARYVQKMVETKFIPFGKRLSGMTPRELIESVAAGEGNPDIPLWAVLWDLAHRGLESGAAVETALFGYIHMLEHKLLREYWRTPQSDKREASHADAHALLKLKRSVLDLQRELERAQKANESLRTRLAATKTRPNHLRVQPAPALQSCVPEKVTRLRGLLSDALNEKRAIEADCARLQREIDVLAQDLLTGIADVSGTPCGGPSPDCPFRRILQDRRVAMVGGLDSLERHYRSLVAAMGGAFRRHDGTCRNGACPIEDCIRRADLVVCPVDVNSHNAAKAVKRLCKSHGIPCRFLRTAGLSALKAALEEHFSQSQVA